MSGSKEGYGAMAGARGERSVGCWGLRPQLYCRPYLWFNQTGLRRRERGAAQRCWGWWSPGARAAERTGVWPLPLPTHPPGAPARKCPSTVENALYFRCTAARARLTFTSSNRTADSKKSQENVILMLDVSVRHYFNIKYSSLPQTVSGVRKEGMNAGKFLFGQHMCRTISVKTSRDERNHLSKIITCTDTSKRVLISMKSLEP